MADVGADNYPTITDWIAHWKQTYDQSMTELELSDYVGHWVRGEGKAGEETYGFIGLVIGYAKEMIRHPQTTERAYCMSLVSDEGMQFRIIPNMKFKKYEDEETAIKEADKEAKRLAVHNKKETK